MAVSPLVKVRSLLRSTIEVVPRTLVCRKWGPLTAKRGLCSLLNAGSALAFEDSSPGNLSFFPNCCSAPYLRSESSPPHRPRLFGRTLLEDALFPGPLPFFEGSYVYTFCPTGL